MYYTIDVNGNLLEDYFGNTMRFDCRSDAEEYITDHIEEDSDLRNAEIIRQK